MGVLQDTKRFMEGIADRIASLPQIYQAVFDACDKEGRKRPAKESIRATIYHDMEKGESSIFKRLGEGFYFLKGEKTASILIEGDSRSLSEIEDNSIDCIITDHPWSDKKAHQSGNQADFVNYDTFKYNLDDFKAKARVLKSGCYMVEFLPVESATNWKYLRDIKDMADSCGLKYYAQIFWRKFPKGYCDNTGRTTKGVEQILIFSKGKPRRLSKERMPYLTRNQLPFEAEFFKPLSQKERENNHKAEKPIPLYEFLIEMLTEEDEVCLDQFGGSCNLAQACVNKNRWGIVYELCHNFVKKAVDKFKMTKVSLFEPAEEDIVDKSEVVAYSMEIIPKESTDYQYAYLKKVCQLAGYLLTEDEKTLLSTITQDNIYSFALDINEAYKRVNISGYSEYNRPCFDLNILDYEKLNPIYAVIDKDYVKIYPDEYTRVADLNFKLEAEAYAEYCVKKGVFSIEHIKRKETLIDYLEYIKNNDKGYNIKRTERLLTSFISA